jgi:hypothetical protein
MYLTTHAYGIGGYLSTGGITYFEEAKSFFGLGDADRLLGFFHLGIPKREIAARKKGSLEDKLVWIA